MMWFSFALLALLATAQGRAVNISNTWVLPEEGFPVFYRYFRDRISWYEADAVCQFHHANLVTVDTTAQYDAVRAYLKELDISSAVWVGLIRSNPDGDFTWTDYRGLSGDGYWSTSPDSRSAPLCAAADPVADYRWEARACGGPTVASFICELPVPQWALGNEGCMVRALPALTILYLPESAAVQLTADCGLARVKRVQCTGNVKRADLLKDISCAEEDTTITPSILSSSTAELTTDLIFTDQESQSEFAAEDVTSTSEHEDENENPITIIPSFESRHINFSPDYLSLSKIDNNKLKQMFIAKNVNLDSVDRNNQQSNFIPKIASDKNVLTDEEQEKLEDNIHMQHKMLHEEFAKFGNFENIFTQPTDHFVPPLVMAKAKISDDMTVISLAEKHAQHLAEQNFPKQVAHYGHTDDTYLSTINVKSSTKAPIIDYSEKPLVMNMQTNLLKSKKDKLKLGLKKYSESYNVLASKFLKSHNIKPMEINKATEYYTTSTEPPIQTLGTSTTEKVGFKIHSVNSDDGPIIDLKVIIKEKPLDNDTQVTYTNVSEGISKSEIIHKTVVSNESVNIINDSILMENKQLLQPVTQRSVTLGHEVITITIPAEHGSTSAPTIFEITTLAPIFHDNLNDEHFSLSNSDHVLENLDQLSTNVVTNTENMLISHYNTTMTSSDEKLTTLNFTSSTSVTPNTFDQKYNTSMDLPVTNKDKMVSTASVLPNVDISNITNMELEIQSTTTYGHEEAAIGEYDINTENNLKNSSDVIDDFQSPLLSGANEPLPRPNRSRRPQQQQIRNKFNPFRILG